MNGNVGHYFDKLSPDRFVKYIIHGHETYWVNDDLNTSFMVGLLEEIIED